MPTLSLSLHGLNFTLRSVQVPSLLLGPFQKTPELQGAFQALAVPLLEAG